jgi:hypothetical protein
MTHLEILQKLPSPIREQAIENCKNYIGEDWIHFDRYETIAMVLYHGVNWHEDGLFDYWADIYDKALNGEFDDRSVTLPREDWEELKSILAREVDTHGGSKSAAEIYHSIQSQLNK